MECSRIPLTKQQDYMAEAKQYVALEDFDFRGVHRKKGDVFRITDEKAAKLGSKVCLAKDAPASSQEPVAPLQKAPMEENTNPGAAAPEVPATPTAPETPAPAAPAAPTDAPAAPESQPAPSA